MLLDIAHEAWEARDATGITSLVGHQERGRLLWDNIHAFREAGIYEQALVDTYMHGPYLPVREWGFLFALADRQRLRACGRTVPSDRAIRVFRGVHDSSLPRARMGFSWTTDPHIAAWFASRPPAGKRPAVFEMEIQPVHVLCILDDRKEREVVVDVYKCGVKPKKVVPMPAPCREGAGGLLQSVTP
jgi:hypothetical protein